MEGRALASLARPEVTQLLAGQRRDDDAADAHRPGPGERLGVDPGADHEDAADPLAEGRSLRYLVPDAVVSLVRERDLYGGRP